MPEPTDYLALDDASLLRDCDVQFYRSSGPGGQHRNKVSTAVRLSHRPTGVVAHGDETRSQAENKRQAVRRLRMNLACRLRRPIDPAGGPPPWVRECVHAVRGGPNAGKARLTIGPRDGRFWRVGASLLDLLDACAGQLSTAAACLGISTSNFASVLQSERHLLAAAQDIRKRHGLGPLK